MTDDSPCLKSPTKDLILLCAKRLLRDHAMGNYRDPHGLEWARWIVRHNGPVPQALPSKETP